MVDFDDEDPDCVIGNTALVSAEPVREKPKPVTADVIEPDNDREILDALLALENAAVPGKPGSTSFAQRLILQAFRDKAARDAAERMRERAADYCKYMRLNGKHHPSLDFAAIGISGLPLTD